MKLNHKLRPRISAGKYKGRRLSVPTSARPVTERVKLITFDILGERIIDTNCLDLFAGSGSYGIEALSRGASKVDFVDSENKAFEILKANLESIGIEEASYSVIKRSYISQINAQENYYDIIFADPPFDIYERIRLDRIINSLTANGIFVLKAPSRIKNKYLHAIKSNIQLEKRVGRNTVYFISKKAI